MCLLMVMRYLTYYIQVFINLLLVRQQMDTIRYNCHVHEKND